MQKDDLILLIICILMILVFIVYLMYIIIDVKNNKNKIIYYNENIRYDVDWTKYNILVKKQRKIIFRKKTELFFLKLLIWVKELKLWK